MKTLRCLSARNHNPSLTDHDSFGPRLYSLEVPLVVEEFWRDEDPIGEDAPGPDLPVSEPFSISRTLATL